MSDMYQRDRRYVCMVRMFDQRKQMGQVWYL